MVVFKLKRVTMNVLDLSVPELLHFEEVNQNFSLLLGSVKSHKAPKAEVASNRVLSKRILTSTESKFI